MGTGQLPADPATIESSHQFWRLLKMNGSEHERKVSEKEPVCGSTIRAEARQDQVSDLTVRKPNDSVEGQVKESDLTSGAVSVISLASRDNTVSLERSITNQEVAVGDKANDYQSIALDGAQQNLDKIFVKESTTNRKYGAHPLMSREDQLVPTEHAEEYTENGSYISASDSDEDDQGANKQHLEQPSRSYHTMNLLALEIQNRNLNESAKERVTEDSGSSTWSIHSPPKLLQGRRLADRYVFGETLGEGGFGAVYGGFDRHKRTAVAMKVEKTYCVDHRPLYHEFLMYNLLKAQGITEGLPEIHYFGKLGADDVLVMQRLGSSANDLWIACADPMPLPLAAKLACQVLEILEKLHACGVVHRDIKPGNILTGVHNQSKFYLADLGLATTFRDSTIEEPDRRPAMNEPCGTAFFAPLAAHDCRQQSPKDDLEGLGYTLIALICGRLPWDDLNYCRKLTHRTLWELTAAIKRGMTIEYLCRGAPPQMVLYFNWVRSMRSEQWPDYSGLRRLLASMSIRNEEWEK